MKISIYSIKDLTGEIIYIGSTTQKISKRISHHLTYAFGDKYSKEWNRSLYDQIRKTCDRKSFYDYFKVEVIYTCDVDSKREKLMIEREYVDKYNPKDNDRMPYATKEEKEEQGREAARKWKKNNPERNREINRLWREKQKQKSLNLSKSSAV